MLISGLTAFFRTLITVGRVSELMKGICNPDDVQQTTDLK